MLFSHSLEPLFASFFIVFILFVFIMWPFPREVHYFASFFNQQYKESRLYVDGRHILRLVVYSRVPRH